MTDDVPEIRMVPVNAITVLNPRSRNKRVFQELVTSIEHLGLKKPITVSQRPGSRRYDLACGQGRLEAFIALGETEIPAIIIDATEDDCFVMSLVENLARRQHTPLELVRAIGALKERGYSHAEIAAKVDFSTEYIYAICLLLENGEEKLINAVERGIIPHTIAMEIAKAKEGEVQQALAQAYQEKALPGNQVLAIRQIIEQRATSGKGMRRRGPANRSSKPVTSEALIRAYQRETERQKLLVKRASLARSRLLFVSNAFRRLEQSLTASLRQVMTKDINLDNLPASQIAGLSLDELREAWRHRYGQPPQLRSAEMLALMLAYRIQADQAGGVSADLRRSLRRPASSPGMSALRPGTKLSREWQGVRHDVVVEADGKLSWSGERYASLSHVARAITGTRWNGPRFFGLRTEVPS